MKSAIFISVVTSLLSTTKADLFWAAPYANAAIKTYCDIPTTADAEADSSTTLDFTSCSWIAGEAYSYTAGYWEYDGTSDAVLVGYDTCEIALTGSSTGSSAMYVQSPVQ